MASGTSHPELASAYLSHLAKERRLSPLTCESYARDIGVLLKLVEQAKKEAETETGISLARLQAHHIRRFAAQLHASGFSGRSLARMLSAWRGFFNWLSEQLPLAANPVDGVRPPRRGKPLPKALSADDAVLRTAEGSGNDQKLGFMEARELHSIMNRAGLVDGKDCSYKEYEGAAHNERAWAGRFDEVLVFLFGK